MGKIGEFLHKASEGKVFKNKITGIVGSELILLAKNDNIENYEETDKPILEESEEFIEGEL